MALPSTELPGIPPAQALAWPAELIQALPLAICLIAADDGRLLAFNRAAGARATVPLRPGLPLDHLLRALQLQHPDGRPCQAEDLPLGPARRGRRASIPLDAPAPGRTSPSPVLITLLPLAGPVAAVEALGLLLEFQTDPPPDHSFAEMMAVLAHELRAPLTALRGGARALRRHWPDIDEAARDELLRDLDSEGERLHELVDGAVDFLRSQAGRLRLRRQATPLPPLAEAASAAARQRGGAEVRLDLPGDLPPVDADPARLARILRLLLDVASKLGSGAHPLVLAARAQGDWCEVSLSGQQLEISPALIARVAGRQATWQPDGESGLALLLCIARALVEAHGGDLRISASGGATSFDLRLPCAGAE